MSNTTWSFTDHQGSFIWDNPAAINELYFPLCNELGMMSAITPSLHGDLKTSQDTFVLLPTSVEDLHNSKAARNFWCHIKNKGPWSTTGNSALAHTYRFNQSAPTRIVEAGLLWHKMTYTDEAMGLSATHLNFIPLEDTVELMMVTIKNISDEIITLTPYSAIPLYGRSAENIRDHRHVTSLVNRPKIMPEGLTMQPVIHFDETGHKYNHNLYYVLGSEGNGQLAEGTIGSISDFIGLQGDLEWPEAVVQNKKASDFTDTVLDGKEAIGALEFKTLDLAPRQTTTYILMIGLNDDQANLSALHKRYNTIEKVKTALSQVRNYWESQGQKASFSSGLKEFDGWISWVQVQPVFRKIFGCSFLPYHDYGKGGRGWRDLWQDLLSLILLQPDQAKTLLLNNFAGIRMDGTNATIIGSRPGEFIADRNNIPRVWMDHGSWPYITTKLYIDQSGDLSILFEKEAYFRDRLLKRASIKDENFSLTDDSVLKNKDNQVYTGTVLEHLLVQHLCAFYNVGEHNIMLLEGADWNDTLDMARQRGESVAFTALYGSNMLDMADLLSEVKNQLKVDEIDISTPLLELIGTNDDGSYDSIEEKREALNRYFDMVQPNFTGDVSSIKIDLLIKDLREKGLWIKTQISENEFIETPEGDGFFNGYYNNDGQPVDGVFDDATRMYLTGQVFPIMYGMASKDQIAKSYQATKRILKDGATGGYKLNTPLGPNQLNFGRGFSFAYGDKENGATFSHMVVMYMNALYQQHFVEEAFEVFMSVFDLCMTKDQAKIYPGIPEYFNLEGKGMYHYLTGSASWLFLTVLTQMYGVRGSLGDLTLNPKLTPSQYENGKATVSTSFNNIAITVHYHNDQLCAYENAMIQEVRLNGQKIDYISTHPMAINISRESLSPNNAIIDVIISEK